MLRAPGSGRDMTPDGPLSSYNLPFLEALYEDWQRDPSSVDPQWRPFLEGAAHGNGAPVIGRASPATDDATRVDLQHRVERLIANYRLLGHIRAKTDPLGRQRSYDTPALDLESILLACSGCSVILLAVALEIFGAGTIEVPLPALGLLFKLVERRRPHRINHHAFAHCHNADNLIARQRITIGCDTHHRPIKIAIDRHRDGVVMRLLSWIGNERAHGSGEARRTARATTFRSGCQQNLGCRQVPAPDIGMQVVQRFIFQYAARVLGKISRINMAFG